MRWRPRDLSTPELGAPHRVELAVLAVAAIWSLRSLVVGHLTLLDSLVLIGLYALYLRLVSDAEGEEPDLVGVSAALAALPALQRRRLVRGLMGYVQKAWAAAPKE